jgi:hypothetical protein
VSVVARMERQCASFRCGLNREIRGACRAGPGLRDLALGEIATSGRSIRATGVTPPLPPRTPASPRA